MDRILSQFPSEEAILLNIQKSRLAIKTFYNRPVPECVYFDSVSAGAIGSFGQIIGSFGQIIGSFKEIIGSVTSPDMRIEH
jgi:hypothetical protein